MRKLLLFVALAALLIRGHAAIISLGQTEDFESGGLGGWGNGTVPDPTNVSTGGPLGVGDNFLQVIADGSGSGGKLTTFNRTLWSGNFSAVNSIRMSVANFGATSLTIRISLRGGTLNGSPGYVSADSITLAPSSGWQLVQFNFSSLTPISSPAALATFLSNVAEMRIFHAPLANTTQGVNVVGTLGIDNLRAVPEPAGPALLLVAGGLIFAGRRKARMQENGKGGLGGRAGSDPYFPTLLLTYSLTCGGSNVRHGSSS